MSIQARATQYGKLFGNWKIRDFIGEGSQGKTGVFRIIKNYENFQDENALKVVTVLREDGWPEELTEEAHREYEANKAILCAQAVNEVKLMNRLAGDPYVVSYQNWEFCDWEESGQFGCDLLIQMPMLVTLRRLQKTGEYFSGEEIRRVGRDICKALIRCGEEGILHRDIKPANIFLSPNRKGNYMLGDFGISRIVEGGLGGASTSVGTLDYAAPEQFISGYDSRVDIYSLGLTLYELANQNHLPFWNPGRRSAEAVKQRLSGSILPPPSQADRELSEIILKACAFQPENRYQTAEEFLAALDDALMDSWPGSITTRINLSHSRLSLKAGESQTLTATVTPSGTAVNWSSSNTSAAIVSDGRVTAVGQGTATITAEAASCQAKCTVMVTAPGLLDRGASHTVRVPGDELFRLAQEGDASAQDAMGMRCYVGRGTQQNYEAAVSWFRMAAEQGNAHAMLYLSICYYAGLGVECDHYKAFEWTLRAAEHGDPASMRNLGRCYLTGKVVLQDLRAAVECFRKGAELGSPESMVDLAQCYWDGIGIEKDLEQAEYWFQKAAELGYIHAKERLNTFRSTT